MRTFWCLPLVLVAACSAAVPPGNPAGSTPVVPTSTQEPMAAVATHHVALVRATYVGVVERLRALRDATKVFTDAPTAAQFDRVKQSWLAALPAYSESEVFRFYGGPIDDAESGPEARVNAWPIDEQFIDELIARPAEFPSIDGALLESQNEKGGEKNISAGFHAAEYLLWGKDESADGPGRRPYTDFVGDGLPARRRAYLRAVTELLLADLSKVSEAWDTARPGTYASKLLAGNPQVVVEHAFAGLAYMSASELPRERMYNAYETKDQEEEHSCFSDSTLDDLVHNAIGLENVYLGRTTGLAGPGLDVWVRQKDASADATAKQAIADAIAATRAIPAPFDQAILGDDQSEGSKRIVLAMTALRKASEAIVVAARAVGVTVNVQ